jgi:membrane fusion protein, multidrug efflux system
MLEVIPSGVTVPVAAVQTGLNGSFTYVVQPNSTVELRPLTLTLAENNVALMGSGLKVGEEVVPAGQFELRPGAKVQVSQALAQKNPPTRRPTERLTQPTS